MSLEAVGPLTWSWTDVEVSLSVLSTSQTFHYKNIDWFLTLREDWTNIIHLHLASDSRTRNFSPFFACLLVSRGRGVGSEIQILLKTLRVDVNLASHLLWKSETSYVKRIFPEFSRDRRLAFRIQFTEQNPHSHLITVGDNSWELKTYSAIFADASIQTSLTGDSISCLDALSTDIGKMLDSESDADLEIECGGHITKAHKGVLCARSSVFAKMLESNMLEGNTGMVKVQDMDKDTLKALMNYMHTGRLDEELTHEATVPLYEAADMYDVQRLKRRCSHLLLQNLTVDNACHLLAVVDAHGDGDSKEGIIRYILEEKIPQSGEHWETFCQSHPSLAIEVCNQYVQLLTGSEGPSKKRRVC